MSPSVLQSIAFLAALPTVAVFVLAFRLALREARAQDLQSDDLPRAELHVVGPRWNQGAWKQRLQRKVPILQAGLVAVGITGVFIMFLCLTGTLAALLIGA